MELRDGNFPQTSDLNAGAIQSILLEASAKLSYVTKPTGRRKQTIEPTNTFLPAESEEFKNRHAYVPS